MTIIVSIPDASASRSKMQKKGWKCWAKWLTNVATPANDGYAYEGEFTSPGSQVECEIGDVLLHVDQSSSAGVGVVMQNKSGKAFIKWIASADSESRKWCGPLAKPSRQLLAMSQDERIKWVAGFILDADRSEPLAEEVAAYWSHVAGRDTQPAFDPSIIANQVTALFNGLTNDQIAEVYRLLPAVEHGAKP